MTKRVSEQKNGDALANIEATSPEALTPRLLLSGLDSLYVSYYLDTANSFVDREQLEWDKTQLVSNRTRDIREYELGSETFALMPNTKRVAMFEYLQSDSSKLPDVEWALESLTDSIRQNLRPETWESDIQNLLTKERFGL